MNKKFLISCLTFLLLFWGCSEKPISEKQRAIDAYKEKQGRLPIINLQPEEARDINEDKLYLPLTKEEIPITFYKKGVEHASQGKFEEAKKEFNKALDIYQFDKVATEHLAILKDMEEGIIDETYAIHIFKGERHTLNNKHQQAVAEFQKAIQINPNYAIAYSSLGLVYFYIGQNQQAITELQKAIDIKPTKITWRNDIGIVYNALGQNQQAVAELQNAIRIDSNCAMSYASLGYVYFFMGQADQAIAEINKAIKINPHVSNTYNILSMIYHFLGQYQKAITYNKKAIQVNPGDGAAYAGLGLNYLYLSQFKEAIPHFQRSIQLDPYFIDAQYGIGFAYFSLAQYRKAQEAFKKLKKLSQSKGNHKMVKRAEKYLNKIKELAED